MTCIEYETDLHRLLDINADYGYELRFSFTCRVLSVSSDSFCVTDDSVNPQNLYRLHMSEDVNDGILYTADSVKIEDPQHLYKLRAGEQVRIVKALVLREGLPRQDVCPVRVIIDGQTEIKSLQS